MITGQRATEDLGGPLRIAQLSGAVAERWHSRKLVRRAEAATAEGEPGP